MQTMSKQKKFSERLYGVTRAGAELLLRCLEHPRGQYVRALGDSTRTIDTLTRQGMLALMPLYTEDDRDATLEQLRQAALQAKEMLPDDVPGALKVLYHIRDEKRHMNADVYKLTPQGRDKAQTLKDDGFTCDNLRWGKEP